MARGNTWVNNDGLTIGYERRDTINEYDSEVHTLGRVKQMEVKVDYTNVANFNDAVLVEGTKRLEIPADSVIVNATMKVIDTITGSTALDIGLKEAADGSTNDPNGLIAATTAFTAGDVSLGAAELLLGTTVATTQILSVTETGAMTAGEFVVLVEYIEPQPSQASPDIITGEI